MLSKSVATSALGLSDLEVASRLLLYLIADETVIHDFF